MKFASMKLAGACAATALMLAACGGGGGGSAASDTSTTTTTTTAAPAPAPALSAQLVGTAAVGAALAYAPVSITNSAGESPCEEASITTDAAGSYTCTLKAGQVAPFFVVVTDPTGTLGSLVSVATTAPAAGATLTVNATPLTTAILAQLSPDGNALSLVSSKTVDTAALQTVTANVLAQLAPVLASINAPADYDPFLTSITAATAGNTGNTADFVLDVVKVVTDPATGKLALATIDNPTPVLLATATTSGATVAAPDAGVSSLSQAAQLVAQKFTACFAVPATQRVVSSNTTIPQSQGGPEVNAVDAACQDFVADATNAAGIDFLQNGYHAGQLFYGMLISDTMTGAQFSVPEIMAYYPKSASATAPAPEAYDRAIVNIRYVDNAGNPGNVVTVASRIPGSSSTSRPTEWWLVGNQHTVDVGVRATLRRVEQFNASNTGKPSTFQTGIQFSINTKGPGSTGTGGNLALARIKGPGLPAGGIVYKTSADPTIPTMDVFNKTGSLTTGTACGNIGTTNCPILWFQRTNGLTGTSATTLRSNPVSLLWAQGSEIDITRFVKGAQYTVELFYGSNTGTADVVLTKTMLTDVVPATMAVNMAWNAPGAQTLAALDPAGSLAGAQAALPVDWVLNPAAPQIGSILAVVNSAGSFGAPKNVPRGATSAVYDTATVPAFTTTSIRTVMLGYRATDGSSRTAAYTYN